MFFKLEVVTRGWIVLSIFALGDALHFSSICQAGPWRNEIETTGHLIDQKLLAPEAQSLGRVRILKNLWTLCGQVKSEAQWDQVKGPIQAVLDQGLDWSNKDEWILENWFSGVSVFESDVPSFRYYAVLSKAATKTSLGKLVPKHLGDWVKAQSARSNKGAMLVPIRVLPQLLESLNGTLNIIQELRDQGTLDERFNIAGERIQRLLRVSDQQTAAAVGRPEDYQKIPSFSSLLEMAALAGEASQRESSFMGSLEIKREREEGEKREALRDHPLGDTSKRIKSDSSKPEVLGPPTMVRVTQPSSPSFAPSLYSPPSPSLGPSVESSGETSLIFKLIRTHVPHVDLLESFQSLCPQSLDVCLVEGKEVSILYALYKIRGLDVVQMALRKKLLNFEYRVPGETVSLGTHLLHEILSSSGAEQANLLVADPLVPLTPEVRSESAKLILNYLMHQVASVEQFKGFLKTYEIFPETRSALQARMQENFEAAIDKNLVANIVWWTRSGLVTLKN